MLTKKEMKHMPLAKLVKAVDRKNPEVKELASRLELANELIENHYHEINEVVEELGRTIGIVEQSE